MSVELLTPPAPVATADLGPTVTVRPANAEDVPEIFENIGYWAAHGKMLVRPMQNIFENLRDFYVAVFRRLQRERRDQAPVGRADAAKPARAAARDHAAGHPLSRMIESGSGGPPRFTADGAQRPDLVRKSPSPDERMRSPARGEAFARGPL